MIITNSETAEIHNYLGLRRYRILAIVNFLDEKNLTLFIEDFLGFTRQVKSIP